MEFIYSADTAATVTTNLLRINVGMDVDGTPKSGCSADYNKDVIYCGQPDIPSDHKGHINPIHVCLSPEAPYCNGYKANKKYGDCSKYPPYPGKGGQWCDRVVLKRDLLIVLENVAFILKKIHVDLMDIM